MKKPLPPTCFLGAIVGAVALHFLLPIRQLLLFPWRLIGIAPILIGILLNLVADKSFKTHDTTVKPFEKSRKLVTGGVFRITRNPMYLGMTLILFGLAGLLGSATPLVVATVLPVLFDRVFITAEERILQDTFGDEFRQYRKRVRRWL